jgi:ABC-2 type transport system permease protein
MLRALVLRSLGRSRALLLTLGLVLGAFQVVLVAAAAYLHETKAFSQIAAFLPVFLQQLMGAVAFTSFGGLATFGYFHPIVVVTFVGLAIFVASEPAGEVEVGLVNLVLARPVPRRAIVWRTILAFVLATTAVALAMVAANRSAVGFWRPPTADPPPVIVMLKLAGGLLAVAWTFGGLSLLLATLTRRRAVAAGAAGVTALALYLLNFLAGFSPPLGPYGPVSPFHYYEAMAIVAGSATWLRDVTVLLTTTAVFCALAFAAYSRRDL